MALENHCPSCGAQIPSNAPEGVCPQCLMKAGLENDIKAGTDTSHTIEGPGTKIGHYELLELIGEGGMGMVYLAEQKKPVKRKVALKIVKLGMDTKQVVARFEAERQTLALLEHPNIAHVFDAGTMDSGRPYFVMEYVEGKSITKYCDEQRLSVEQRLGLFQQICDGVHYAHQKGIIHRDIKPSNILVSVHGDKAIPKIIDFGIAKAITQPLTEKTSYTEHGQLLGTPEYMSPEQAEMAYQDIDTRSDIYSLGVVLYELLTGVTPFDAKRLREGGIDHIQQVICQEEPRTPSAQLTSLGDKAKAVAKHRRTQIIPLTRRLHRELEWIPMKAMRKDRMRRYRSVSELADDIQNYLTGTPLIAGPESTIYRARKFVHKHAGSVATAALLLVVIILGLVVSIIMGCRAEQARKQEAITRAQAEDQAEDYRRLLYCNHIALADVAYRDNNIHRLRELLDLCPEDLRGWEWKRLKHISDQSCMTLRGHAGWIIGISPDGKRIASGSHDNKNEIKIWDTETGDVLRILHGHHGQVVTVYFSPDGKRIISGDTAGTIKVWNATTSDLLMSLKGHKGNTGGKYSPDGRWIVSGSVDQTLKVWDAETGAELRTLRGHEASTLCHAISPDSRHIVSGGRDNTIRIWDLATGMEVMTLHGHQSYINAVVYSPDGKRIISGSWDSTIKLWDASTGEELMTIPGHKDRIYDVTFSPDGKFIASSSRDGTIKLWNGSTGAELMTLHGHQGSVSSVVFSPDGKLIASGSEDGTIKLWDVDTNHEHIHINVDDGAREVNFSRDGRYILSGSSNGAIKVWNRSTRTELITLHGHKDDTIAGASFSPDGECIISCQVNETTVWDVETGEKIMSLRGHEGYLYAVFSPDGKQLACMTVALPWDYNDDTINLLDATTGEELMSINSHRVASVAFSPDGQHIVSGSDDGSITVWNSKTGNKIKTLDALEDDMPVSLSVSYSLNGKYIISRGTILIKLWAADTGAEVLTLPAQQRGIWTMALSPDGKRLVVGDRVGIVKLWDTTTGTELMTLREQRLEEPLSLPVVNFSPDGKTIAIGSSRGFTLLESE